MYFCPQCDKKLIEENPNYCSNCGAKISDKETQATKKRHKYQLS